MRISLTEHQEKFIDEKMKGAATFLKVKWFGRPFAFMNSWKRMDQTRN